MCIRDREGAGYHLRWFTPGGEIDLCGHATLGTAYVLFRFFEKDADSITFQTLSGALTVLKKGELLEMDFPAYELKQIPVTPAMEDAFGVKITEAWMGRDLLCVTENADAIPTLTPDQAKLMAQMCIRDRPDTILFHPSRTRFESVSIGCLQKHPCRCRNATPVSYTHLDVYKRQVQDCLDLLTGEDGFYTETARPMACLFYTSLHLGGADHHGAAAPGAGQDLSLIHI